MLHMDMINIVSCFSRWNFSTYKFVLYLKKQEKESLKKYCNETVFLNVTNNLHF